MSDLIGKTISNRYRVDSLLGRGGMGDVYKVWDSQRGVFLAMKVLHADLAEDKVFLRRFAREAETLSALQHPHIVRFYGLEQEGRLTFMLMDYIEGTTLRGQIFDSNQPFSIEQVLQIVKPVCSAVHYAHQMGRVHCDIKPANIMVKSSGDVLVADFGIARMMENNTTTTMAGAGTPAYMAPEQVLGKNPVPQTDIYALGIVLYEMLAGGERPFTGEQAQIEGSTVEKVRWEQITLQPPSLRKYNPNISPQSETVVLKCLEKNSSQRYANAMELLNALEKSASLQSVVNAIPIGADKTSATFVPFSNKPAQGFQPAEHIVKITDLVEDHPQKQKKSMMIGVAIIALIVLLAVIVGLQSLGGVAALMPKPSPTLTATSMLAFAPTEAVPTNTSIPVSETNIPPTFTPTITPTPAFVDCVYKIQSGDSFYGVATRFGVTTDSVKDANGASLQNPGVLALGQELLVLSTSTNVCLEKNGVPKGGTALLVTEISNATFDLNGQTTNTPNSIITPIITNTALPIFIESTAVPPTIAPTPYEMPIVRFSSLQNGDVKSMTRDLSFAVDEIPNAVMYEMNFYQNGALLLTWQKDSIYFMFDNGPHGGFDNRLSSVTAGTLDVYARAQINVSGELIWTDFTTITITMIE